MRVVFGDKELHRLAGRRVLATTSRLSDNSPEDAAPEDAAGAVPARGAAGGGA
jgi:hypothetical protein